MTANILIQIQTGWSRVDHFRDSAVERRVAAAESSSLSFGVGAIFWRATCRFVSPTPYRSYIPRRSWALIWRGRTLIWRGLGSQIPRVLRHQSSCERSVWVYIPGNPNVHFFCSNTFAQEICASGLFCQMDKFSGIPPNIGLDWVLSI